MSSFNHFQPFSSAAGYISTPTTSPANNDTFPLCPLDDWLDPTAVDLFNKDILNLLPISPPLTVSSIENQMHSQQDAANDAFISLFPEIMNVSPPKPVQTNTRRLAPRPIAIMPKTADLTSGGATYNNHLKRPFMEVTSDSKDDITQKRQKNTDAARRSRLKKVVKMENLEKRVSDLEGDNARLTTRVAVLESEKNSLVAKDKGLEDRIKVLEAQLAEAHKALTCKIAYEMKSSDS